MFRINIFLWLQRSFYPTMFILYMLSFSFSFVFWYKAEWVQLKAKYCWIKTSLVGLISCMRAEGRRMIFPQSLEISALFVFVTLHRGAFFQFLFQWIHYCNSRKSTGRESGKTHLCALSDCCTLHCKSLSLYFALYIHNDAFWQDLVQLQCTLHWVLTC